MIYEQRLTIPKNTAQMTPATAELHVHPGVLRLVEVSFPPGPSGLAHLQIYHWEAQVYPSNPNSDFVGDDIQLVYQENLEIVDPPFVFVLVGWNDDDTYPHTVTVRMQIDPFELFSAGQLAQSNRALTGGLTWLVAPGED